MTLPRKLAVPVLLLIVCCPSAFSQTPQARIDLITSALRAKEFDTAVQLTRSALKEFPNNEQLWALQGVALASEGQADKAFAAFQQALKISPNYIMALQGAAQLQFQAGSQDAVPLLNHLLRLRPGDPTSHAMLGVLRYRQGDCAGAADHFEKAGALLDSQPAAPHAYATCLVRLRQLDGAAKVFQRAVALQPDDRQERHLLAAIQVMAHKPQDAIATLGPLLGANPDAETLELASAAYASKWSIRGGVGVYRDWVVLGQSVDEMPTNPPGLISATFTSTVTSNGVTTPLSNYFALSSSGTYPYNFPLPPIPAGTLNAAGGVTGVQSNVWSLARNLEPPLAANYVIGVEHQLPWKLVAGANYSGSQSYNALVGTDQNRFAGGATLAPCPPPNQANRCESISRLNPNFGTINYVTNANGGSYNAMILTLRGTPTSRLNFQGSYTLSRALSNINAGTRFDQDGGFNVPNQLAYSNYYGDANWDVRNRFSFSGVYTVPGFTSGFAKVLTSGWTLGSIIVAQSGTPFWVIDNRSLVAGGDYNADGVNYDVPNAPLWLQRLVWPECLH